jgi:hypothetical protein
LPHAIETLTGQAYECATLRPAPGGGAAPGPGEEGGPQLV